jgi:hypothetical protein
VDTNSPISVLRLEVSWNWNEWNSVTYCSRWIAPKQAPSSRRYHHSTVYHLRQSSNGCMLCKTLIGNWTLERLKNCVPGLDKLTYNSMPTIVDLIDIQSQISGIPWALLKVAYELPLHQLDFILKSLSQLAIRNVG